MEEKKPIKIETTQPLVEQPISGLNLGTLGESVPENTLTYALNCINESTDGKMLVLGREESNIISLQFKSEVSENLLQVCGQIKGEKGVVYIFLCNLEGTESEIGYVQDDVYKTVVNTPKLNFRLHNPIQGIYRLRLGCEPTIYWTEQNCENPIRYFNFNRLEDFKNSLGEWDVDTFSLFYSYQKPTIENVEVLNTGGKWRAGSYNVSIQLVDENLNATPWLYTTAPIPIFHENLGLFTRSILGSSQSDVDELGGTVHLTNKSFKVVVNNIDDSFPFYRLCLIEASSFTKEITNIHVSNYIPSSQLGYIFTGNNETDSSVTEEDLKLDVIPLRAEVLAQQDNRFLMGNVKGIPYDLCSFQRFASKIAVGYVVKEGSDVDKNSSTNFTNSSTYFLGQGFLGFEIYALGIVYIFPDFETPVYHIPGRPINKYFNINTHSIVTVSTEDDIMPFNNGEVLPFTTVLNESQYNGLASDDKRNVLRWQIRDVSNTYSGETLKGYMSYHENKNHTYPDINSCGMTDYWGEDFTGQSLVDKPIRHHRFPSRNKQPHVNIASTTLRREFLKISLIYDGAIPQEYNNIYVKVEYKKNGVLQAVFTSDTILVTDTLEEYFVYVDNDFGTDIYTDVTVNVFEQVSENNVNSDFKITNSVDIQYIPNNANKNRLLGFNISNIEYPHPGIIGHYIVVGVRDADNRTILDSGFMNPIRRQILRDGTFANGLGLITNKLNLKKDVIFSFLANFQFNKEVVNATHFRAEGYFNTPDVPTIGGYKHNTNSSSEDIYLLWSICNFTTYTTNTVGLGQVYPLVTGGSKIFDALASDTAYINPDETFNLSMGSRVLFHKLTRNFLDMPTHHTIKRVHLAYGTYCIERPIHPILEDITYTRTHNNINVATSTIDSETVFGGDSIISHWSLLNHGLYKLKKSSWTIISKIGMVIAGIVAIAATVVTAGAAGAVIAGAIAAVKLAAISAGIAALIIGSGLVLAGTIGISKEVVDAIKNKYNDVHLYKLVYNEDIGDKLSDLAGGTFDKYEAYFNELLQNIHIENSDAHVCLRGEYKSFDNITGEIYRVPRNYRQHLIDKYLVKDEDDPTEYHFKESEAITPEIYHCNPDYTRRNLQRVYYALPYTYDCCSECIETYKQRIVYSEQSFQEEKVDHYRVFQPWNYVDLEGSGGEITDLFVKGKNLFIMCTESIWMTVANYQTQVTDELTTYIGTGEFLAIPPIKMISDGDVKAGTQHRWGTTHAINGTFYINEAESKIYILTGEGYPEAINIQGIKGWSEKEIPLKLKKQFPSYPLENCPQHIQGIGFTSVFDNKYNRFILTKKDFKYIPEYPILEIQQGREDNYYIEIENISFDISFDVGNVFFGRFGDFFNFLWEVIDIDEKLIIFKPLTNKGFEDYPELFENHSWTLSYSLYTGSWVSWHSYIPDLYFSVNSSFYSVINKNKELYKHNHPNHYGFYYGKYYPHIIEFAFKSPMQNFTWEHLQIHTKAKKYDTNTEQYSEDILTFFDEAIVYNDTQCTGLKKLRIKQKSQGLQNFMSSQILNTAGEINISNSENIWYLNEIRNFVSLSSENFFTKKWSEIAPYYPIDKVINESVVDHEKVWYELELLRSKFIKVRLIMNSDRNNQTVQLMTHFGVQFINPSYR